MYLVDTSIWINLFSKKPRFHLEVEQLFQLAVAPPIVQELIQGLPTGSSYEQMRSSILALPCSPAVVTIDHYLKAADIYRAGRRRGLTIRSSVDCLIAALALEEKLPVWHLDRDFSAIASFTDLHVTEYPW
ncbi:MAG: PIN domain nuclease [Deltaproteobacteria bacterium]|nr:PIN domain nuclease [Deltaproteobacteria bacterium]